MFVLLPRVRQMLRPRSETTIALKGRVQQPRPRWKCLFLLRGALATVNFRPLEQGEQNARGHARLCRQACSQPDAVDAESCSEVSSPRSYAAAVGF